jgi:hypothetical protein
MASRFHVFQSRCGIFRPANGTCETSIGHFGLMGAFATAHFCTVNKYVSFWIRLNHSAGQAPAKEVQSAHKMVVNTGCAKYQKYTCDHNGTDKEFRCVYRETWMICVSLTPVLEALS